MKRASCCLGCGVPRVPYGTARCKDCWHKLTKAEKHAAMVESRRRMLPIYANRAEYARSKGRAWIAS